ncbi:MAG: hypothetical protein COY68_04200 [Candidatus Levybacteria bacterium CG_4_10_14_0_8_um_filter_35_23]|nr:MAG: hypothetical protein COY68_04200 [Candidatus Levybacteria bacterium CG_4_10_14_0_8_um_filter_35_23]
MNKESGFNSVALGESFRERILRPNSREVFISKIPVEEMVGSTHAFINCDGYGIVRRAVTQRPDWQDIDILPELVPQKLEISQEDASLTQIFRVGACNFRCWYCFVDFKYLKAEPSRGDFKSPSNLLDLYQQGEIRPRTIYLTGGQPDLVPEWTLWMMEELERRGMDKSHFLWQDDNLSSLFLFDKLTPDQLEYIGNYENYARATCIKGISPESFSKNTGAAPEFFELQIEALKRLVAAGIDTYTYITLLGDSVDEARKDIPALMDDMQRKVHPNMLLRVFPSKIIEFAQTSQRAKDEHITMIANQNAMLDIWKEELSRRYSSDMLALPKSAVSLK